jgi:hypothetical protein
MGKLHREMRPWRAHLKESRLSLEDGVLPKDILNVVYEHMSDDIHNVPLSKDERAAYLRFIYDTIYEMSPKWFDKRDSKATQASELQKKLSKDKANLHGFSEEKEE